MATTFTWTVTRMTVYEQLDTFPNFVNKVYYSCTAEDNGVSKTITGICELTEKDEPYILYKDLTEGIVLDWIWNHGVDKAAVESELDSAIHQLNNLVLPLPWQ